jgi:hypothetical protein
LPVARFSEFAAEESSMSPAIWTLWLSKTKWPAGIGWTVGHVVPDHPDQVRVVRVEVLARTSRGQDPARRDGRIDDGVPRDGRDQHPSEGSGAVAALGLRWARSALRQVESLTWPLHRC